MKKITYLLFLLLFFEACSSIHDIPFEDKNRGAYLFGQKLKSEYTNFFVKNVFKNGSYVYAGPSFLAFNNFQMIKLKGLAPNFGYETVYQEKDGTQKEYTSVLPLPPYYGGKFSEDKKDFLLEFSAAFQSFQQIESLKLNLVGEIRCKKDVKCHLIPDIDFALFKDPYDFSFRLEDVDKIVSENVELSNFTDTEATAISNRMIFMGMGKKAADLAIGANPRDHYLHGYYNVGFKNDIVSQFDFRMNHDLHFFTRR